MRIITLEEHYRDEGVARASAPTFLELSPHFPAAYDPAMDLSYSPTTDVLGDLGEGRIAEMDENHISMQVLSSLTTQQLPAEVAVELVTGVNDALASAVRGYPDRFSAFAALPTVLPEAAADELRRCKEELGFVGTLIMGRTGGEFLDAPHFRPILQAAADLQLPVYLHPAPPPRQISDASYADLDPLVSARFQTSAWGWHQETAVHFLHLILAGTFDRHPELQFILGHWGEMIPFYLDRLDEALPRRVTGLDRTIGEYVRQNVYLIPSGLFSQAQLQHCLAAVGADRIMYSVDYPFIGDAGAASFLEEADILQETREKIAHATAEQLLGL